MTSKTLKDSKGTTAFVTPSAALLNAITKIDTQKRNVLTAISDLKFAGTMIMTGLVEAKIAPTMKTTFEQKLTQIEDLGGVYKSISTESWVQPIMDALDVHEKAGTNGHGAQPPAPALHGDSSHEKRVGPHS